MLRSFNGQFKELIVVMLLRRGRESEATDLSPPPQCQLDCAALLSFPELTVETPGHQTSSHCPGLYTSFSDCPGSRANLKLFTLPVAFSARISLIRAAKIGAARQSLAVRTIWSGLGV